MQNVRLETKDGGFVADHQIPPYKEPPDVVVWGWRIFALRARLHERWIYREVSMAVIEFAAAGAGAETERETP